LETLGVWKRGWEAVAADVSGAARAAVTHVRHCTPQWWMHVDVDVMDPIEFPAQGLPDFPDEPGGLSTAQLTTLVQAAAAEGGCVGASIAIYDPDQDPDGSGAEYVVDLANRLLRIVQS
jgi:arginase